MEEVLFKHFLQELRDSGESGDAQKLLVQASYFESMSLTQQIEASVVVGESVSPKLFLKVYKLVLENNLLARRNPVLRKLLKKAFLSDLETLRDAIAMFPLDDEIAKTFILSCIVESGDAELKSLYDVKIVTFVDPVLHRTEDIAKLVEYKEIGSDDSVLYMLEESGKDVGLDIVIISKLSKIKTESAWRGLTFFLGSSSSKVRGYAEAKLEEIGARCANVLMEELETAILNISPDKSIAILTVLRKVGCHNQVKGLRRIGRKMPDNVNMRVAFLDVLAHLDSEGSAPILMENICDGVDDIAFSAATLLDANCSDRTAQGIQNAIESNLISLTRMVEIVVFSHAKNIAQKMTSFKPFYQELSRFCSLSGMEKYADIFGIAEEKMDEALLPATIWAIDDSRMILRMYDRFAVESGVALRTFESGKLLALAMNETPPHLIFVDLNMPDMNGIAVSKMLNANGWSEIPRILVTTQGDAGLDEDIKNGLFNEIIYKPFTSDLLSKVIKNYL